jgi:hypothetical protein
MQHLLYFIVSGHHVIQIFNPPAAQNVHEIPRKNAVRKQHEILEYQKGWSFCGHLSVIRYSFESCVFFMSFPEQHVKKHV